MNTQWQILEQEYQLFRFPPNQHDKSLQAWDSADELIAQHLLENPPSISKENSPKVADEITNNHSRLVIMNDSFGALAVALKKFNPICISDSYISNLAIKHNSVVNNCETPFIIDSLTPFQQALSSKTKESQRQQDKTQTGTENLANEPLTVVIKITKNLDYLAFQIQQIKHYCQQSNQSVQIIAGAKTTLITSSVMNLFEQYLSSVTSSKAKKKSRLVFAVANAEPQKPLPLLESDRPMFQAACPSLGLSLYSHANVFGKNQIDIGGRFLAENLPALPNSNADIRVVDLGCGNGLLGVEFIRQNLDQIKDFVDPLKFKMVFTDESFMAIESARFNVETAIKTALEGNKNSDSDCNNSNSNADGNENDNTYETLLSQVCEFQQDDCLTKQDEESADLILCNPPFHQQQAITTHIGEQMIHQASKVLKNGGELYLVANRHLPYQSMLKKAFGGFRVLTTNNKFTIYVCVKKHRK